MKAKIEVTIYDKFNRPEGQMTLEVEFPKLNCETVKGNIVDAMDKLGKLTSVETRPAPR